MELPFTIDPNHSEPAYRQLSHCLKEGIEALRLLPGQLLPSTRELASRLGVSRATVLRSYEELLAQGYLETVDGVGTFVSRRLPALGQPWPPQEREDIPISQYARGLLATQSTKLFAHDWPELHFGCAPPEMLPIKQWRQVLLKHCRQLDASSLDYGNEPFGFLPLRKALCQYLARSRALRCQPEQIIVCPSSLYPLHLVCQLLIDPGSPVAMAEPGFPYARHTFSSFQADLSFVSVDDSGILVEQIKKMSPPAKLIYVNPSHHNPTGAVLTLQRAHRLIDLAVETGATIIEDDLDCEYSYATMPPPSLQGLAQTERVIYLGSFWQTLFPLINVGYMVIPHRLIDLFSKTWSLLYHSFQTHLPLLDQLTLTELLTTGIFERHLLKTGQIYTSRRQALLHALAKNFGKQIFFARESSGLHTIVRFGSQTSAVRIEECALEAELPMVTSAAYYANANVPGEYLIPFAHLAAAVLEQRVSKFASLLAEP